MTPNKIAKQLGISNSELISLVREKYPNYSKIANSMANNPSRYGLRLTAEAERMLKGQKEATAKKPKNPRISVPQELKDQLNSRAKEQGISVEELLRGLINGIN